MNARALFFGGVSLLAVSGLLAEMDEHRWIPIEDPAIQYGDLPVDDAVSRLGKQIESGKVKLEFTSNGLGYLPSLLKNLGINVDSQVLVFSKTSFNFQKFLRGLPVRCSLTTTWRSDRCKAAKYSN
jgi:hypothetical protein